MIATLEQLLIDTTDDLLDMLDRRLLEIRVKARESLREHQDKARSERDEIVRSYEVITRVVLNRRIPAADIRKKIFDLIERVDIERLRAAATAGARPLDRDGLDFITNSYRSVRIFAARFLEQLELHPDPEAGQKPAVLEAVDVLREANRHGQRALPRDVSTEFASNQWKRFVSKGTGRKKVVDRKHFEIATLSSLGTALRSGEVWVENSRRYASPGSYLMPRERWVSSKAEVVHQLGVEADAENALDAKVASLTALGAEVEHALKEGKLKRRTTSSGDEFVNPTLTKAPENESVDRLQKEVGLRMPRVELPSLLVEVDRWTGFSKQVAHPTHGRAPQGDGLLHFYAAILAQASNIGFTRMAASCAGVSVDQLTWTSSWFLHEEALRPAFAVLVDFQAAEPLGRVWGTGTLSSSDGQRFPVAGLIREARANRRYFGRRRGLTFYTSTNDQFGQYGIKVIPSTARDATYVLDEILDNETEAEILEHTVDTHGYTDILFALFDLLGMRFAPRIRDVADARLWGIEGLDPSIAKSLRVTRTIRRKRIVKSWDEMLRVAGSLKRNWVTASLLVTKLQAQPQRGVAGALLAYGRICKTEHVLRYFADEGYRRRIGEQLNKGEEIHGLRRFLFFGNRAQLSRKDAEALLSQAICLNIVSNAVVVWNTVYMGRVLDELRAEGFVVRDEDVARLSPCRFEHINHLGRYHFDAVPADGDFRPIARRRRPRP